MTTWLPQATVATEPALAYCRRAAFPLVLQDRRQNRGLSRLAIAEFTGLSQQAVIDLEAGAELPTLEVLFALADALGTDAAELLHETRTLAEEMILNRWIARRRRTGSVPLAAFFSRRSSAVS